MTKRLVDIDDADLEPAREALATTTLEETVSRALREAAAAAARAALDLEALHSARSVEEHRRVRADRRLAHEYLTTEDEDWQRALAVHARLADTGRWRSVGLADRVVVLHRDADFDTVASVTGQPVEWVVARGSVS